jgi:hypothetical protein
MPYLGNTPTANFASVTKDTFSGNGSTTAFTLSKPATTNGVAVYVENVRQIPTTAYAVSGTTLTFTGAPVSGTNNIYVMHHNTPVSTATHPAAQDLTATSGTFTGTVTAGSTLDMNGTELILDADADSSITADTDDQIDIKGGGTDRYTITAAGSHYFRPTMTEGTSDTASGYVPTDGAVYSGGFVTAGARDNNTGFLSGLTLTNNNNAVNGGATNGRPVAVVGGTVVTSDTNAGDDSGATLDLYTKAEAGNVTKHFSIASDGTLTATDTSIGSISDERLKKDIVDFTYSIDDFKKYKPRKFNWKNPELHQNEENVIGFIAQELETVDNRFVYSTQHTDKDGREKDKEFLDADGIAKASKLFKKDAMYISVIQQLIARIEALESK